MEQNIKRETEISGESTKRINSENFIQSKAGVVENHIDHKRVPKRNNLTLKKKPTKVKPEGLNLKCINDG